MAVKAANNDAIIQAFPVAAFAKDGAPVIEVDAPVHQPTCRNSARASVSAPPAWTPAAPSSSTSRLPGKHRSRSHRDLHAHAGGAARRRRRTRRRRSRRRHDARQQRHRGAAPQHGEAARKADDAAPVRRARRLLHHQHDGLHARRVQGRAHAATSRAGGWKRRIPTRRCPSR